MDVGAKTQAKKEDLRNQSKTNISWCFNTIHRYQLDSLGILFNC